MNLGADRTGDDGASASPQALLEHQELISSTREMVLANARTTIRERRVFQARTERGRVDQEARSGKKCRGREGKSKRPVGWVGLDEWNVVEAK